MSTIWKYTLELANEQHIEMPIGASILCAGAQGNNVCIWAQVDPDHPRFPKTVYVCGTGHQIPDRAKYLGTASLNAGQLILHVFEKMETPQ